jgi:hypothetical protein
MIVVSSPIVESIVVTSSGAQGPPGPPGPGAPGGIPLYNIELRAAINLSGHRAIIIDSYGDAIYADNSSILESSVVGITTSAASLNTIVYAAANGATIVEPSWSWVPQQPIFLGSTGYLTQTAPTSGIIVQLGLALSTTKMLVDIKMPIALI